MSLWLRGRRTRWWLVRTARNGYPRSHSGTRVADLARRDRLSVALAGGILGAVTGRDIDAGVGARSGRRWDVALSFAGAQRDYVSQVAQALKVRGVRCFYDADEQVRLWGTYLAEELPRIYAQESAAVVVFVSADYAEGDWTRLERRAAFSRAVREEIGRAHV